MRTRAQLAVLARARAAAQKPRGERNGAAKLTDELVRKIRRLRAAGERPTVLAERFCVDRGLIWRIVNNKNWTHV